MQITDTAFDTAQESELANWVKDAGNDGRILHELTEHSEPASPLRRLTEGRHFERALDVGVGCFGLGFLGVHAAGLVDRIEGIDPLPRIDIRTHDEALQTYIDTIRARVHYTRAKAEAIPAGDATYDLVACINVVDHAQSPEAILNEINRVLKPGGIFVFSVSTLSTAGEAKWRLQRRRRPNDWHFLAHPHTYQWATADRLVRIVPGRVLWRMRPTCRQRIAGRGRMSFWIIEKANAIGRR